MDYIGELEPGAAGKGGRNVQLVYLYVAGSKHNNIRRDTHGVGRDADAQKFFADHED
jgi:hypothetical protein